MAELGDSGSSADAPKNDRDKKPKATVPLVERPATI